MTELGPSTLSKHKLRRLPQPLKRFLNKLYWLGYDGLDFLAEMVGWIPFHFLRLAAYRLLQVRIGSQTSIHRKCRFYRPSGVQIGKGSVINRDVLLDGRSTLKIGNSVSISESTLIFTLEHDPNSPTFAQRGGAVQIHDYVFVGSRATILPGITVGEGAVVATGAVVTRDVAPYTIVGGVPARPIGERRRDLSYSLDYSKFLG